MTREEQIRQAGIEYTIKNRPMCVGGGTFSDIVDEMNRNPSFEEGAKWADKTIIEKACAWLYNNAEDYIIDGELYIQNLINSFKEAMEE